VRAKFPPLSAQKANIFSGEQRIPLPKKRKHILLWIVHIFVQVVKYDVRHTNGVDGGNGGQACQLSQQHSWH